MNHYDKLRNVVESVYQKHRKFNEEESKAIRDRCLDIIDGLESENGR